MISLLLAGFKDKLPLYAGIAGGVLVLVIFIVGMVKGVLRVRKGGFCLAIAGVGFIALYKFVPNPLSNVLTKGFAGKNCQIIWAVLLMLAVVLATLILRGALAALFTPESERREAATTTVTKSIDGVEFEMEGAVEDHYSRRKSRYDVARETSPGILSRLFGGIVALLNFAIIVAIIAGVAAFIIDVLNVKGGVSGLLGASVGKLADKYVLPYVLDFITVAIVFGIGYHGFHAGTIGFTRSLLMKVGTIAVVIFGLAAPFIDKVNDFKLIDMLIDRCAALFSKVKKIPNELLGQITAGVLLAIIGAVIMLVINLLLKLLIEAIENTVVLRVIDGALATIIYLALAVALCAIFWGALYLLDGAGIFKVSGILAEKSFSKECFDTAAQYLSKIVDKYLLKFAA